MGTGICCLSYDQLNRLTGASASAGYQGNSLFCWSYDSFGNRLGQSGSNLPFANAATCQPASGANVSTTWAYYTVDGTANTADNGLNRLTGTNARGSAAILTYDGAGDVTNDGDNSYLYDAEGRICAVNTSFGMTQYVYDAAGARVAKGTISTWSCDQTTNGFAQTNQYILGPNGEQLTEEVVTGGTPAWKHTNVYAAGALIATYENDGTGPHFRLTDWLGTMRAQTNYAGILEQTCTSLPFGDTPTPCITATEQFFTGKERDTEIGLDYFGARYYASGMGRWMSPDGSAKQDPVPYAKLDNPQSLNLYSYVYNNPINGIDPDGHFAPPWHFLLSFFAALSVGDNPFTAAKLGFQTAWVDVGTQGTDPASANIHGMAGTGQDAHDAYLGTVQSVADDENSGNVPRELHTVQDPFAKGHEGFADWSNGYGGFGGFLKHQFGDWLPNPKRLWGAFKASRKALKNPDASPESLLPGDPDPGTPAGPDTQGGANSGTHDESGENAAMCSRGTVAACSSN